MSKALSSWLGLSLCILGYFCATNHPASAQVTSDDTVNTQVTENGNTAEITGGETRGDNLFHSFQDFSVPTGNEAAFLNANDISNIFSRVTGGDISNIDGLISANGSANLFLINPAGIVFGEGARLDIGGSFYGSSASSILFEDGEFSATDLDNPPLLTINAPIGLGFRDEPGDIVNRSIAQNSAGEFAGLEVLPGNNLAFIGGNINFEAGEVTASGGNITLGGLSEAGIVSINEDGSLSFPNDVAKANITLSNGADVNASGTGGGNVTVNARNLSLTAGEFGSSLIGTGIRQESTSGEAQAGDIAIDVAENITLDDSRILNQVDSGGVGNSGNITINTGSLEVINGGDVDASTFSQGDAGAVNITATGNLTFDGEDSEGFQSGATSLVDTDAVGNAGGVTISTTNLNLTNGGRVDASTFGQGNAGAVDITATGDLTFDGENSEGFQSGATSLVNPDAVGNAGGVTISTNNLNLTKGGRIDASTSGQGDAGEVNITATGDLTFDGEDSQGFVSGATSLVNSTGIGNAGGVTISTNNLNLTKGGRVDASTFGQGDAGEVNITATGDLTFDGENSQGFVSGATSRVEPDAEGSSGGVTISTNNLNLTKGGRVSASTLGQGDAGLVNITATGDLTFDGVDSNGFASGVSSTVAETGVGDAGGIDITTRELSLTNGGVVNGSTFGQGNAGVLTINANNIFLDGVGSNGFSSAIGSTIEGQEGNAGDINITTSELSLNNGAGILASTFGRGNAGLITIDADNISVDGVGSNGFASRVFSTVEASGVGNAGGIDITTSELALTNGAQVNASTFGQGNAGDLKIQVDNSISLSNSSFISSTVGTGATGDGGNINISANDLTLTKGSQVQTGVFGTVESIPGGIGNAGNVNLDIRNTLTASGFSSSEFSSGVFTTIGSGAKGNGGEINITTSELSLTNGAIVNGSTSGQGNAGLVTIDANNVSVDGVSTNGIASGVFSNVEATGVGDAGGIDIKTSELSLTNGGVVDGSTFGQGNAGDLKIQVDESISLSNSSLITSTVGRGAVGDGGNISISANNLTLTESSQVQSGVFGTVDNVPGGIGNAGNVELNIRNTLSASGFDSSGFSSGVFTTIGSGAEGDGGEINITTSELSLTNGGIVNGSTSGQGNAGLVTIDADNISAEGVGSNGSASGIFSNVQATGRGDAGGIDITTNNLSLNNGARILVSTFGRGNAGFVTIDANNISGDGVSSNGFISGVFSTVEGAGVGDAGDINITTDELSLTNGGVINGSTFGQGNAGLVTIDADNISADGVGSNGFASGVFSTVEGAGVGNAGGINITTDELALTDGGVVSGSTFGQGNAGPVTIDADIVSLDGNSAIVAQAFGDANGGNLNIDANYIIAFPSNGTGNDLVAAADQGNGGDIDLNVEQLFGLELGDAINREGDLPDNNLLDNNTNDIDVKSGAEGFDGTVNINTSDINPVQGATELPSNVVELEQNTANACEAGRGTAQNSFAIAGKGGVPPAPDTPLNSENIITSEQNPAAFAIPQPIETSQGKIQPARGIKVTKSGKIVLTAYRTNNAGERIPEIQPNCNSYSRTK